MDQSVITTLNIRFSEQENVIAVYLIGSYAKGTQTNESDFDLAVIVRNNKPDQTDIIYQLIRDLSFPADLDLSVVDKQASTLFLYEITTSGRLIYEKDPLQTADFAAFALRNYWDTAHIRKIYNDATNERFLNYVN